MVETRGPALLLENRHTGERLAISRVRSGDDVWFTLDGQLPPHRDGPPLHIHVAEDEEGRVIAGTLSVLLDGRQLTVAVFEVVNASPAGRPSLFYMAHVAIRHRQTQTVLLMPQPIQAVLFRVIVALGTLLGRYRGDGWPGCPSRCTGAPLRSSV